MAKLLKELKMNRLISIFIVILLSLMLSNQIKAEFKSDSEYQRNDSLCIFVNPVDVNDIALKLRYEIRNNSDDEFWILVGFGDVAMNAEVFMTEDGETLILRRRLNLRQAYSSWLPIYGRYVRLEPGKGNQNRFILKHLSIQYLVLNA